MKKILLVTRPIAPPWDEASKNFAYFLAKTLGNSQDFELHLMTRGNLPELPERIIQEHVYTSSQNDFTISQKLRSLFFQFIMKNQFDLTHYFFTPTKLNTFFIKRFLKYKTTKTIQTVATLREDLFSDEEIKNLMFGDIIITYSDYAKKKLESLGITNVKRIYPGIDLKTYRSMEESRLLFENYFAEEFVINFTGEYVRLGAIDCVIDAFAKVVRLIPTAKLSLAVRVKNQKDTAKKTKVIARLKENELLEKVVFHDDGKFDMVHVYNVCDVSIFPVQNMIGKFDVPLAVIEAMACEKPIIISDLPILQEFTNDSNSITIERDNAQKLAETIFYLFQNPEKRKALGLAGRKFIEENFDIKKVAAKYEEIYKTL